MEAELNDIYLCAIENPPEPSSCVKTIITCLKKIKSDIS